MSDQIEIITDTFESTVDQEETNYQSFWPKNMDCAQSDEIKLKVDH